MISYFQIIYILIITYNLKKMLFNSFEFILIFLLETFLVFFFLVTLEGGFPSLAVGCIASFYGWWEPIYVPLILGSIIFNFGISQTFLKLKFKHMRFSLGLNFNRSLVE